MKTAGFLAIAIPAVIWTAVWIWLIVIAVQYLRVVTKAARRYLDLTAVLPVTGTQRKTEEIPGPTPQLP